jgi:hypothetical protein
VSQAPQQSIDGQLRAIVGDRRRDRIVSWSHLEAGGCPAWSNHRVQLTKEFGAEDYAGALESWDWLGVGGAAPVLATLFGDVIVQTPEGFAFLDTVEGTFTVAWPDRESVEVALQTQDGQDRYLMGELALAAAEQGIVPGPEQVLSFIHPPVLGGALTVDNLEVQDFVVATNIAGQIHHQVLDLPAGTPIAGVAIEGVAAEGVAAEGVAAEGVAAEAVASDQVTTEG